MAATRSDGRKIPAQVVVTLTEREARSLLTLVNQQDTDGVWIGIEAKLEMHLDRLARRMGI